MKNIYILILFTLGNGSKNGPIHKSTNTSKEQEIKDVSWVCPPTECWIVDREIEAANGMHPKNEPNTLPTPYNNK